MFNFTRSPHGKMSLPEAAGERCTDRMVIRAEAVGGECDDDADGHSAPAPLSIREELEADISFMIWCIRRAIIALLAYIVLDRVGHAESSSTMISEQSKICLS